jgi:hypothetical protein
MSSFKQIVIYFLVLEHNYGGALNQIILILSKDLKIKYSGAIVDAQWYVRNSDLHRDLNIETVIDIIKKMAQNHEWRLHNHSNTEAIQLLNYREATRRLNRTKPLELC